MHPSGPKPSAVVPVARTAAQVAAVACPLCGVVQPPPLAADAGCRRCGAPLTPPLLHDAMPEDDGGRRASHRVARDDRALLRLPGTGGEFQVRVRDLSFSGICLEVQLSLPAGQPVRVSTAAFDLVAQVLRCRRQGVGHVLHGRIVTLRPLRRTGTFLSVRA
jgi:hypothetical protein